MRGRSSSTKSRLRSAGYKCTLCGRRLIDAQTLQRHQKTIHNVSPRGSKVSFKTKPIVQRNKLTNKEKDKIFDNLLKEEVVIESKPQSKNNKNSYENLRETLLRNVAEEGKILSNNEAELDANERLLDVKEMKNKKKDIKNAARRVEFECPICAKTFNVYFTAQKHIQKAHSHNTDGKKVGPNSSDLVEPIRVEQCYKCDSRVRSNDKHVCSVRSEVAAGMVTDFVCSGCNQNFVSLKTFDMHVAGLHSDVVESMFFPTKIEFMNWRLEMERQTNSKFSLYGEYDSKKIYRCNYAREEVMKYTTTAYFCPSSLVVQDFSKGIQVHFYSKHYKHDSNVYMLASKYKKYSITSFLKNTHDNSVKSAYSLKLHDKDLYSQFKKLMESIALNAEDVSVAMLKTLIEKALEMSTMLTDLDDRQTAPTSKPSKELSDKQIAEALEARTALQKRRKSVDFFETTPKPAKRTRNQSLFNESDTKMEPKIVNTFSLASNPNSDELRSHNGCDLNFHSAISEINTVFDDKSPSEPARTNKSNKINTRITELVDTDTKSNKSTKLNTRHTCFNESLSFNDSYKDFIDKNFIGKTDKNKDTKGTKNTVKTRLGEFKQISPKKLENKKDTSGDLLTSNKNVGGIKPITSVNNTADEDKSTSKVNKMSTEVSNVNIHIIENPNVTITKVRTDTPKVTNSQMRGKQDTPRMNTSRTTRGAVPHFVDPPEVNIRKVGRVSSPLLEPIEDVVKKNTSNVSSPVSDPLELNVAKLKSRNVSSALVEPLQVNMGKVSGRRVATTPVDPLTTNSSNTLKPSSKVNSKMSSPTAKKTSPKTSPKVTFNEKITNTHSTRIFIPQNKIKELKYEVREQDNDCNILVLKL